VIPIPYQIILKKFLDNSFENEISTSDARRILSFGLRMNKKKVTSIFLEMKELGWIKFDSKSKIILKFDDSVLPAVNY